MATSPETSAAVNAILRKFHPLDRVGGAGGLLGDHTHPKESYPTVLVASADAREEVKNMADFVCDGVEDNAEINAGINEAFTSSTQGIGRVALSAGRFFVKPGSIGIGDTMHLQGLGAFRTHILPDRVGTTTQALISVETDGEISDLGFPGVAPFVGRMIYSSYGHIHGIWQNGNASVGIYIDGAQAPMYDLIMDGNYTDAAIRQNEGWLSLSNVTSLRNDNLGGCFLRAEVSSTQVSAYTNIIVSYIGTSPGTGHGFIFEGGGEFVLTNCAIRVAGDKDAIRTDDQGSPFDLVIADCFLDANYGIRNIGTDGFNSLIISGLQIRPVVTGIDVRVTNAIISDLIVTGDFFGKSTGSGVIINASTSDRPILIDGLSVRKFDGHGVHIRSSSDGTRLRSVRASHIYVNEIGQHGILLDNVQQGQVHHSEVRSVSEETPNLYDGIHVTGESEDVMLDHNKIHARSDTRYGIHIQSGLRAKVLGNDYGAEDGYGTAPFIDGAIDTAIVYPDDPTYGDNFVIVSGGDLTVTIVDGVGVTEEIGLGVKVVAEDVGVTDTITTSAPVVQRSITEAVGIADEVQSIETKTNSDAVGVTDIVTPVLT